MARSNVTLETVLLVECMEEDFKIRTKKLRARIKLLEDVAAKALDYLTDNHPHKSAAGNDRLPVVKALREALAP